MRPLYALLFFLATLLLGCVDVFEPDIRPDVNVLVVDGTINDLPEEQLIFLSLARADIFNGRFGQIPAKGAQVDVVINGANVVRAAEKAPGEYVLPADFRGQPGSRYQLRVALGEGGQYVSSEQTMPQSVPVGQLRAEFSTRALDSVQYGGYRSGHTLYADFQDPPGERNYYRWDWLDYERQFFCASCYRGVYAVLTPYIREFKGPGFYYTEYWSKPDTLDACLSPPPNDGNPLPDPTRPRVPNFDWTYDYTCRRACWEIVRNSELVLFNDQLTNGGSVQRRRAGAIPFFARQPCSVELRQLSITAEAYTYYKLFQDQTQNVGGVADTPPVAPIGNVRDVANPNRGMVGFFTAASVAVSRLYLDRRDVSGLPYGYNPKKEVLLPGEELFFALNRREPISEPSGGQNDGKAAISLFGGPSRPPRAVCKLSRTKTPNAPPGWLWL